jgi:hypothetical protein
MVKPPPSEYSFFYPNTSHPKINQFSNFPRARGDRLGVNPVRNSSGALFLTG